MLRGEASLRREEVCSNKVGVASCAVRIPRPCVSITISPEEHRRGGSSSPVSLMCSRSAISNRWREWQRVASTLPTCHVPAGGLLRSRPQNTWRYPGVLSLLVCGADKCKDRFLSASLLGQGAPRGGAKTRQTRRRKAGRCPPHH